MNDKKKSRGTILIVDDSVFLRKRVRQALQDDYNLLEANSGRVALDQLSSETVDCIVTDLLMPELSGFEFLEELRRRHISAPVVVLTADVQRTTREKCNELGASALIQKPLNPQALRSVLSSILGG